MENTKLNFQIYDPAIPFKLIRVTNTQLDTRYDHCIILKSILDQLKQIKPVGKEKLPLSYSVPGNIYVTVPVVEIGLQIENIKIGKVSAFVVDSGHQDLLVGKNVIERAFSIGSSKTQEVKVTSELKDDPLALSIELYPVQTPFDIKSFEEFLKYQRRLYNIILISSGEIETPSINELDAVVNDDHNIPENLRLKLAWIDSGSIWITLKSQSEKTLKSLASLFEMGATAELALQTVDVESSKSLAIISQEMRDNVAQKIKDEEEILDENNVSDAYYAWKNKVRERLDFFDEIIAEVSDKQVARELKKAKDQAILDIAKTQLLPMVRNIPHRPQPASDSVTEQDNPHPHEPPVPMDSDRPTPSPPQPDDLPNDNMFYLPPPS